MKKLIVIITSAFVLALLCSCGTTHHENGVCFYGNGDGGTIVYRHTYWFDDGTPKTTNYVNHVAYRGSYCGNAGYPVRDNRGHGGNGGGGGNEGGGGNGGGNEGGGGNGGGGGNEGGGNGGGNGGGGGSDNGNNGDNGNHGDGNRSGGGDGTNPGGHGNENGTDNPHNGNANH